MAGIEKHQTCVLIPAFNEEARISGVLRGIRELGFSVVVSDDASADGTVQKAKSFEGVQVLTTPTNQGKGAALRRGFEFILAKDYQAVILMDADGQHDPKELELFLKALNESKNDVLVGNRMTNPKGMSFIRRATNTFLSWVLSSAAGQGIPDSQCGYRAFKREVLKKSILKTSRFEIESEMLLEAARLGFKIGHISISCVYAGEKSQIHPLIDTGRFIKFMFKYKKSGPVGGNLR